MALMRGRNETGHGAVHWGPSLAMLVILGLTPLAAAQAQSGGNNPAATINGTVPSAEGNVWNGQDHQPTPGELPPASLQQQQKVTNTLNQLDQQLLNFPLPKTPKGGPTPAGGQ